MTQKLFKLTQKYQQGAKVKQINFFKSSRLLLSEGGENTTTVRMDGGYLVLRCCNTLST